MSLLNQLIPNRGNSAARQNGAATERFLVPAYDWKEAGDAFGLEVFVPGTTKDAVEVQVEKGELIITARRRWKAPESWTEIFRESVDADYQLRLNLNETVAVDKINAELENGVLRVTLPKVEEFKPRKIEIA